MSFISQTQRYVAIWVLAVYLFYLWLAVHYGQHHNSAQNLQAISWQAIVLAGLALSAPGSSILVFFVRMFFLVLVCGLKLPATGVDYVDLLQIIVVLSFGTELLMLPTQFESSVRNGIESGFGQWMLQQLTRTVSYFCIDLVILGTLFVFLKAGLHTWWPLLAVLFVLSGKLHEFVDSFIVLGSGIVDALPELADVPPNLAELIERSGLNVNLVKLDDQPGVCYMTEPVTIGLGEQVLCGPEHEAEFVLGHELGHAADCRCHLESLVLDLLIYLIIFWAFSRFVGSLSVEAQSALAQPKNLPLVLIFVWMGNFVLRWLEAVHRRWIERRADLYALELIGSAHGLISFFTRDIRPAQPGIWTRASFFLGSTHPRPEDRLTLGTRWQKFRDADNEGCF